MKLTNYYLQTVEPSMVTDTKSKFNKLIVLLYISSNCKIELIVIYNSIQIIKHSRDRFDKPGSLFSSGCSNKNVINWVTYKQQFTSHSAGGYCKC
jgi:hypothetical protein